MGVSRADNSVKILRNLPISNPKSDLLNVNAYSKFGENALLFTRGYSPETKKWACLGQITPVKNRRNLPINNPKPDLHNINAHTKFGENPLTFTQVIIRKRTTDGRTYDGRTDIIPRHYCVAGYDKKRTN